MGSQFPVSDRNAYISTITGVREVALTGTADLASWSARLRAVNLVPYNDNGRASLLLTAIEARFRGIPFREMSVSVVVSDDGGANVGGAYLAHAFNSSRLLAFAERAFFRTPYHLAVLTATEQLPARIGVSASGRGLFEARMGAKTTPIRREDPVFEGPIYLPGGEEVFYAHLSGSAEIYPFDSGDSLTINPHPDAPIFAQLVESGFAGSEWMVRSDAIHARSKTYKRTDQ